MKKKIIILVLFLAVITVVYGYAINRIVKSIIRENNQIIGAKYFDWTVFNSTTDLGYKFDFSIKHPNTLFNQGGLMSDNSFVGIPFYYSDNCEARDDTCRDKKWVFEVFVLPNNRFQTFNPEIDNYDKELIVNGYKGYFIKNTEYPFYERGLYFYNPDCGDSCNMFNSNKFMEFVIPNVYNRDFRIVMATDSVFNESLFFKIVDSIELKNVKTDILTKEDPWKCQLVKEENGWKRYQNEYWGIEFRFKDEEDNLQISKGCKGGIVISENSEELKHYIYIWMEKNSFKFDQKQEASLKEYLEAGGWNAYTESAELISIKEVKNNNDLTFIEVVANVSGGRQSPGFHKHKICYIEYNKKVEDKNIIRIYNANFDIANDIISTFKFID